MSWLSTCTPTKRTGRSRNRNVPRFLVTHGRECVWAGLPVFSFRIFHSFAPQLRTPHAQGGVVWLENGGRSGEGGHPAPAHSPRTRSVHPAVFAFSLGLLVEPRWSPKALATQNAGFCNCGVILFCHGSARRPLEFNSVTCGGKTLHFGREGDLEPLGNTVGQREDPRRRQTKRGNYGQCKHTQSEHNPQHTQAHSPRTHSPRTHSTHKSFKSQVSRTKLSKNMCTKSFWKKVQKTLDSTKKGSQTKKNKKSSDTMIQNKKVQKRNGSSKKETQILKKNIGTCQ